MNNFSISKSGGKIFMSLVMLSIFGIMVGMATQYPPQARFMPFIVGIPGIVMCVIQLALEIRAAFGGARGDNDDDGMSEIAKAEAEVTRITGRKMDFSEAQGSTALVVEESLDGSGRREIVMWGCFLGLIAGILVFGFWISVPVFILAFLRFYAQRSWGFSLLLTAVGTTIFYCAFVLGLRAVLHEGFVIEAVKEHFDLY